MITLWQAKNDNTGRIFSYQVVNSKWDIWKMIHKVHDINRWLHLLLSLYLMFPYNAILFAGNIIKYESALQPMQTS
jgi:hypothetical protein